MFVPLGHFKETMMRKWQSFLPGKPRMLLFLEAWQQSSWGKALENIRQNKDDLCLLVVCLGVSGGRVLTLLLSSCDDHSQRTVRFCQGQHKNIPGVKFPTLVK